MPLVLGARLRDGRYDAAGIRPEEPEWPPHPARLFCALAASAAAGADWAALRWLEVAGTPQVWANPAAAAAQFAVVWPEAAPDAATLAALSRLAGRVPYLGRSTCPVALTVGTVPGRMRPGWARYVPVGLGRPSVAALRVPYPGYTGQLRSAYGDGRRAWEVARAVPYAVPGSPPAPVAAAASPYGDLVVFGLAAGMARFPGPSLLMLTVTLRQALISRIGTGVPAQISGHGADGRPHVAYLALVDAGHPHADGHVLGVALAVPRQMPAGEVDQVLAA